MRPSLFLVAASLTLAAQASWFSGSSSDDSPVYSSWNTNELRAWLEVHNVPVPKHSQTHAELKALVAENYNTASAWTYDQYASAQKSFADLRETAFDSWDDSRLREFLLEQGVVAPKGPREHLLLLAKQKYKAYASAASSLSGRASATASTAVYGDTKHQMTKSVSSVASQATSAAAEASKGAVRAFDNSKDYLYSNWSENQMRKWLQDKGLLKTKAEKNKDELLQMMHDAYGSLTNPVWNAWSDSYIHDWLVSRNIIKSDFERNRDALIKEMKRYYYSTTDSVYSSWSDSELKKWLVDHGVMKSDAQASRDKMLKMVEDNYLSAKDTVWSTWSDNSLRDRLIENGYLRSDAQVKRDELVKLANEKYKEAHMRTAAYLTWPDARLRAYLREHGISDEHIPGDRPTLLQETRIRYVQTQTRAETLYAKIKELVNSGIYKVEDALYHLLSLLSGGWEETKEKTSQGYEGTKHAGEKGYEDVKQRGEKNWEEVKKKAGDAEGWAGETVDAAREKVGEKVKVGGQKIKGEL